MRWLASLVVLCLVAAAGARPVQAEQLRRDRHDPRGAAAAIAEAHGLAPTVGLRRSAPVVPDARLHPFVLTAAPDAFIAPPQVTLVAPDGAPALVVIAVRLARSSRGPPVG